MRKLDFKNINFASLAIKIVLTWLLVGFIIFPNVNLLISVFYSDGQFSTEAFNKIMSSERALKSLLNSFILAISMVITVNIVGILVVLFSEYFDIKGAKFLKAGYMTSLIYGGVTLVVGYKFVYGANGIITKFLANIFPDFNTGWFIGYGAVIFIMTFACTSNHIIFLTSAIRNLDYHIIEAAKNMGSSSMKTFFKVVFPTLKPMLFAVTILTFLTGLGALSAPLIVGGTDFQTINPMILTFAKSPYSQEVAALLAIILGLATIILLWIFTKAEKKGNYISLAKTQGKLVKQKIDNKALNVIAHIMAWGLWVIYMLPVVLIVLFSFSDSISIKKAELSIESFTLENYKKLFTNIDAFEPYLVSIAYALMAAVICAILSIIIAKLVHKSKSKVNQIFGYIVLIPWLLPSTLIALGIILTFNVPRLVTFDNVIVGTSLAMLIGYIVIKLPFSYRMIKASFYGINSEIEDAAKSMGSSAFNTMIRVILPIILPVVLSVIVLNFNSLLSEFDVSVFLYNPFLEPLGVVIKAAGDETASTDAQALTFVYTVVIMIISSITLYLTQGDGFQKIKKSLQKKK